jgi:hypothetical protein
MGKQMLAVKVGEFNQQGESYSYTLSEIVAVGGCGSTAQTRTPNLAIHFKQRNAFLDGAGGTCAVRALLRQQPP